MGSKLDPLREWICEQLRDDPTIQSQPGPREMAVVELGYGGGKTIFDEFAAGEASARGLWSGAGFSGRVFGRGSWCSAICGSRASRSRSGMVSCAGAGVVTAELCWSRVIAGALVFSKEAPDILWGVSRCLARIGALPEKLVWDREGAIAGGGRPTDEFAGFCGQLGVGWVILDAGDAQAKGVLERSHRFMRSNFLPGRTFANPADFQLQLDGWCDRVNRRVHRTTRAVPGERLAEERDRMRSLPDPMPHCDRRFRQARASAAVSAGRSQRRLDRPGVSRAACRCARLPDRGDRCGVGHRRARVSAPQGVRRQPDVH